MKKIILLFFLLTFFYLFLIKRTIFGLTFDLIQPTGQFQSGQEVEFTININTEQKSYSSTQIGMTYDTQYLELISVSKGNTFSEVSYESAGQGQIIIKGNSASPYSGSGIFAKVKFKIIASSPGSTQLCALFNPDQPVNPTTTPQSTNQNTNPTAPLNSPTLIRSGELSGFKNSIFLSFFLLFLSGAGLFIVKKI